MSSPNHVSTLVDQLDHPVDLVAVTPDFVPTAFPVLTDVVGIVPVDTAPDKPSTRKPEKGHHNGIASDEDLVRLYLVDIGEYPLLTKEDEVRLAQQYEAGRSAMSRLQVDSASMTPAQRREARRVEQTGDRARNTFICSNLRLVVSIAKRYQDSGLPLLDLIQEGNLGLEHAVDKFDWQKGFKFSTYATWWIRQSIARGIAKTGTLIRLPANADEDQRHLIKAETELINANIPVTPAALAEKLDITPAKVIELFLARQMVSPVSLDDPLSDEQGGRTRVDVIPDPKSSADYNAVDNNISFNGDLLDNALQDLTWLERRAISLYYGIETGTKMKMEDVGQELGGISRTQVARIVKRAMARLRDPHTGQGVDDLLTFAND